MSRLVALCSSWMMRKDDTPQAVQIKRLTAPIVNSVLVVCGVLFMRGGSESMVWSVALGTAAMASLTFIIGSVMGFNAGRVLDVTLFIYVVSIMLADSSLEAALDTGTWQLVVLVLDAALVFERQHIVQVTIPMMVCYIALNSVESGVRFGLYELSGVEGSDVEMCDCSRPPCAQGAVSAVVFTMQCIVLLGDFHLTRGFATDVHRQIRRVNASVGVAAQVTAALARYDVDVAEDAITSGKDLPSELAESLLQLLFNLRCYKAYLPHSCLVAAQQHNTDDTSLSRQSDLPAQPAAAAEAARPSGGLALLAFSTYSDEGSSRTPSIKSEASATPTTTTSISMLRAVAHRRRVSVAGGNMRGYLVTHEDMAGEAHAEWMSSDVERWCAGVLASKGVVDLIGGDHRYASFNARQRCPEHASAGVEVLWCRGHGAYTGCVVTGQAVCGDFGSSSVLRYMILGNVASSLQPLERLAAKWRTKVLADGEA
eukprot:Hpha_TRINITY_DN15469_c4_g2::TRINITY_DN15469_c4_g2_i1::g.174571::m.174571